MSQSKAPTPAPAPAPVPAPTPDEICAECLRRVALAHFHGIPVIELTEAEFVELFRRGELNKRDTTWSYQGLDVVPKR